MGDLEREAEFTAYVLAHQDRFVRFAYLLTGDPHSAEDLVQSALANVYPRWHTIHGSPDAYVRQAIVNEQRSWWRRSWRHREVTGSDLITFIDPPAPPESLPDGDLRAQIRRLPTQQRAAIVLGNWAPSPRAVGHDGIAMALLEGERASRQVIVSCTVSSRSCTVDTNFAAVSAKDAGDLRWPIALSAN